jgi:hypothetical protein
MNTDPHPPRGCRWEPVSPPAADRSPARARPPATAPAARAAGPDEHFLFYSKFFVDGFFDTPITPHALRDHVSAGVETATQTPSGRWCGTLGVWKPGL